jgi:hypothetical protein
MGDYRKIKIGGEIFFIFFKGERDSRSGDPECDTIKQCYGPVTFVHDDPVGPADLV